jgi:predicted nucleotidyltransferase
MILATGLRVWGSMPSYEKLIKRWSREKEDQKARAAELKKRLLKNGTPVFKRFNLQVVYLFGSVASGKSRESSDIDLYVSSLPADRYWQFRHELEEAVHLPIDLYTDSDDLKFIKKIIERGEKVYGV